MQNINLIKTILYNISEFEKAKGALDQERAVVTDMTQKLVSENARVAQAKDDYLRCYNALIHRYDSIQERLYEVTGQITSHEAKVVRLTELAKELTNRGELITVFDERLCGSIFEHVPIGQEKEMAFRFRDGTEIKI